MKRILILGSAGAGKSTLAKRLHDKLDLPIIHLDQYYWKPGWIRTEDDEWKKTVEKLAKNDEWIMDGHFLKTLDNRLPTADTVILLDFSRFVCLKRILKRQLKNDRHDQIEGCKERMNIEFIYYILWKYPQVSKKRVLRKLEEIKGEKNVVILKSNKETESFLLNVSKKQFSSIIAK